MLYTFLVILYIIICMFLAFIILLQKGKSSLGFGALGGGAQMLFGGSGGQDIFQKITWVLGSLFIAGSLFLALMKNAKTKKFKYAINQKTVATTNNESSSAQQEPQKNTTEE